MSGFRVFTELFILFCSLLRQLLQERCRDFCVLMTRFLAEPPESLRAFLWKLTETGRVVQRTLWYFWALFCLIAEIYAGCPLRTVAPPFLVPFLHCGWSIVSSPFFPCFFIFTYLGQFLSVFDGSLTIFLIFPLRSRCAYPFLFIISPSPLPWFHFFPAFFTPFQIVHLPLPLPALAFCSLLCVRLPLLHGLLSNPLSPVWLPQISHPFSFNVPRIWPFARRLNIWLACFLWCGVRVCSASLRCVRSCFSLPLCVCGCCVVLVLSLCRSLVLSRSCAAYWGRSFAFQYIVPWW